MSAWYNEIDPVKAEWLRELIRAGLIAPGDVDERSIADVKPAELLEYAQCHFFAGIGAWSYALRCAGWPDDRPVWTGSCPCPSFSTAGKGQGFRDPRHLWPHWFQLIRELRPAVLFGEQVSAAIGHGWLDLVQSDLEGADYAVGAAVLGACSVGAPHIRQRLYFVAHANVRRPEQCDTGEWPVSELDARCVASGLGISKDAGFQERELHAGSFGEAICTSTRKGFERRSDLEFVAHPERDAGRPDQPEQGPNRGAVDGGSGTVGELGDAAQGGLGVYRGAPGSAGHAQEPGKTLRPSPLNGFWRDADWIGCRDGRWRPVEPGTFPLASGVAARVGRLRGYGDALCAPAAQAFIETVMEVIA